MKLSHDLKAIIPHILFALYSLLIAPLIIGELSKNEIHSSSWIGWALLLILLLEIPALHILLVQSAARIARESGGESGNVSIFLAWMAHMLIVIIVYFQALRALGMENGFETFAWPLWFLPVWIIKEIYVLGLLFKDKGHDFPAPVLLIAGVIVFVFSCLVHTAYWGLLMRDPQFSSYSTVLLVMSTLIFGLFFAIFYAGVNLPQLRYVIDGPHGHYRRNWIIGLVLAGFSALWPFLSVELDGRYNDLDQALNNPADVKLLALQQRSLKHLPPEISRLSSLRKLYLFENKLQTLPPTFGRLRNLEDLSLGYNRIQELPPGFERLVRLKHLKAYANRLTVLPPEIGELTALEELSVGWNPISSLPAEIGKLKNLRILNVSRARLTGLPPEIGRLSALRELKLSNNQIRVLPEEFYGLDLDTLSLKKNPLSPTTVARLKKEMKATKLEL